MCCSDFRGHQHHGTGHRHPCICGCPGSFDGKVHPVTREQVIVGIKHRLGRLETEIKTLQGKMDGLQNET